MLLWSLIRQNKQEDKLLILFASSAICVPRCGVALVGARAGDAPGSSRTGAATAPLTGLQHLSVPLAGMNR